MYLGCTSLGKIQSLGKSLLTTSRGNGGLVQVSQKGMHMPAGIGPKLTKLPSKSVRRGNGRIKRNCRYQWEIMTKGK